MQLFILKAVSMSFLTWVCFWVRVEFGGECAGGNKDGGVTHNGGIDL